MGSTTTAVGCDVQSTTCAIASCGRSGRVKMLRAVASRMKASKTTQAKATVAPPLSAPSSHRLAASSGGARRR